VIQATWRYGVFQRRQQACWQHTIFGLFTTENESGDNAKLDCFAEVGLNLAKKKGFEQPKGCFNQPEYILQQLKCNWSLTN